MLTFELTLAPYFPGTLSPAMGVGAPNVPAHLQHLHQLMRPLLVPSAGAFASQTILPTPVILSSAPGKLETAVRISFSVVFLQNTTQASVFNVSCLPVSP